MSETDDNGAHGEDGKLVAAEYVLGVLDAKARRDAAERLEKEPDLAREAAFWEERLGGLADDIKPVAPPAETWSRIEAAVSGLATRQGAGPGLWQSLPFWRSFAIGSAAVAALCIAALGYVAMKAVRDTGPLLATLGQKSGQPGFVAAVGSDGKSLTIVPASLLTANQKSMELWLIPAGDRPHSLGLIAPSQPVRLTVPPALAARVTTEASLAVSLEEPGGSKTGRPSDDIIAVGKLTAL